MLKFWFFVLIVVIGVVVFVWVFWCLDMVVVIGILMVMVNVLLLLLLLVVKGWIVFDMNCVFCYGENVSGRDGIGLFLIDLIYWFGYYVDIVFELVVRIGVW